MYGMNECRFIGRLGSDIHLQTGTKGAPYCYFRLAVDRGKYTNKDGDVVEREPLWLTVSANGNYAKYLAENSKKGSLLMIDGEIDHTTRSAEKEGVETIYKDTIIRITKDPPRILSREDEEQRKVLGVNQCRFLGRMAADVRLMNNAATGKPYCYSRMAIDRGKYTTKEGVPVEREPLWLDFSANGKFATLISNFCRKGMLMYICGELDLATRKVEKDGIVTLYNDATIRINTVPVALSGTKKSAADESTVSSNVSEIAPDAAEPVVADSISEYTAPDDISKYMETGICTDSSKMDPEAAKIYNALPF